jgi:hypothetical protein
MMAWSDATWPRRARFAHSYPGIVVTIFAREAGCGKEVSFARELTRKSRLFEEHLHGHPRIDASPIAG